MLNEQEKQEVIDLKEEIFRLEHNPSKAGQFEPNLIPLYRRMQELYKKQNV